MRFKFALFTVLLLAFHFGIGRPFEFESINGIPSAAAVEPAPSQPTATETEWLAFRNAFPLHMQTPAVSEPYADETRTLIVSEPPPHVTVAELTKIDAAKLGQHTIKQWTIGFDGWVKDVVFTLPKMGDEDVKSLEKKLSTYLFGTDYRSYALKLPVDRDELKIKYPLDIRITTVDLERFYQEPFSPLGTDEAVSLSTAQPGVYQSREPGLIAWVMPKLNLQDKKADIRKFALDSDLVLGAIARGDDVILFGRERVAPFMTLPPLRTEMILALAATKDRELGQSYERTLFGAGPSHARWDWAPIWLSPELLDTEYGSILNNTDQMLKGWTTAGFIEYHNFPYAAPSRYPFDVPLVRQLRASQLLFNWNTTGFGLQTKADVYTVYATTRTGALPVIYRPESEIPSADEVDEAETVKLAEAVREAEEQGYSYYASLNDPLLAKAVQYTTVYQIFTVFDVAAAQISELPRWNQSAALKSQARKVLAKFHDATRVELQAAVKTEMKNLQERLNTAADEGDIEASLGLLALKRYQKALVSELRELQKSYHNFVLTHGDKGPDAVVRILSLTRESTRVGI